MNYTNPELRIENHRVSSGKGAGPLQREHGRSRAAPERIRKEEGGSYYVQYKGPGASRGRAWGSKRGLPSGSAAAQQVGSLNRPPNPGEFAPCFQANDSAVSKAAPLPRLCRESNHAVVRRPIPNPWYRARGTTCSVSRYVSERLSCEISTASMASRCMVPLQWISSGSASIGPARQTLQDRPRKTDQINFALASASPYATRD